MKNLIPKIAEEIKRHPTEVQPYMDMLSVCRNIESSDFRSARQTNQRLRNDIARAMKKGVNVEPLFEVYRKSLLFDAPHVFDAFLLYIEIDRKPEKRFYQPRRRVLKEVVDCIQDLLDDKLDELFISLPPRTGKTTLLMFLVTFLIGRNSEKSNLYSAFSDTITDAMYKGVLEVIQDPTTYLWQDVFPNARIVQTNSQLETINIDRAKRYPSITCRSLYGTLNGACDCDGFLISDDLIGGIEEALNRDRLIAAWSKVDNNLLPRAKECAKILWCGTRWSIADPAGTRLDLLENDARFKTRRFTVVSLSALDEKDESRFNYDYGVGFSTQYYHQRRASFEKNDDMASWLAQYMQSPIERQGTLFSPGSLRYYNGELPEGLPDRVIIGVDPAFGGGDYVSGPIGYQYGEDIYVHDVVFDNRDKSFTQPLLAGAIIRNSVTGAEFEATKATASYKEGVEEILKAKGYRLNITTKAAPSNVAKFQRIFDKAPEIREHMLFLEPSKRSKEYNLFMQNVFSYKTVGKNKNDDAPDSLAILMGMVRSPSRRVQIVDRPF